MKRNDTRQLTPLLVLMNIKEHIPLFLELPKILASSIFLIYSISNYLQSPAVENASESQKHAERIANRTVVLFNESLNELVEFRIFCLISTTKPRHGERAIPVLKTWAKRCDGVLFASDFKDQYLPSEAFYNKTGREYVSFKIFTAWKYVYYRYIKNDQASQDFQWFIKADDDTFVVVENLRKVLSKMDHTKPHYMGRPLSKNKTIYHKRYGSGSIEILSAQALKMLVTKSMPNQDLCPLPQFKANEDAFLGFCLNSVGITLQNGRDHNNRERFLIYEIWKLALNVTLEDGANNFALDAISFHYMEAGKMLAMEFLVHHLKPLGISIGTRVSDL